MNFTTLMLFIGFVVFNAGANTLMKLGMNNTTDFSLTTYSGAVKELLTNWYLIGGCAAYVISLGFYLLAIKDVKLGVFYPLATSAAIILVTILSVITLKENITANQIIGGLIIITGIFVLTR